MSPFASQLALVRALLPTLTPTTSPELPFTPVAGDLPAAEEPGIRFRAFEVTAEAGAPITEAYMAPRSRQARKRFTVTVLYDTQHDIPTAEQIIAEDDDLLIASVEAPPFATNVQMVTCAGSALAKANDGDFWRRSLTFDCLYVHAF